MRKAMVFVLALCLVLTLTACFDGGPVPGGNDDVGSDWHVWGLYDFVSVGEQDTAIIKAYDQEQLVGYDLYEDGSSRGPLLGEIRCTDGGFSPEDLDVEEWLLIEDYNGDGVTDVGAPMKTGDVLWYVRKDDPEHGTAFVFAEVVPAAP